MGYRMESDSMGQVKIPENALWGAQTQRALEHFAIGDELIPHELLLAYVVLKKAAAMVNHASGRLTDKQHSLIVTACDELLHGQHADQFPLKVWISGSGTQCNMNMNEVISNRCCQLAGTDLGSKRPVHPNDHVNMAQSTNDTFPVVMHMSAAKSTVQELLPALQDFHASLGRKAKAWADIVKVGRTHMQDAVPVTLGQEFSGYAAMIQEGIERLKQALPAVYEVPMGGTAVGTGLNAPAGFAEAVTDCIAAESGLPFCIAKNRFAAQGSHDALVHLNGTLKTLAVSLHKIADDIRLLACGPRCGIGELRLPENEPGSSIMPGKVNPTQCEALTMVAIQIMANDQAVALGGASGTLEMNAYKPLIIHNLLKSIRLLTDGCTSFRKHLLKGLEPNRQQIDEYLSRSLMLVTALSPVIGYDKAAEVARHAMENDLTLRQAVVELEVMGKEEFDRLVEKATAAPAALP